jgi:hypothetical protein
MSTLQAPVTVDYDERGVPHIRAENEADMYRALGFVHAQDRLFQMELLRRLARRSESDAAFDRAIALAPTSADAAFLRARRSARVNVQADADLSAWNQKKAEQTLGPSPTGRYEDNGQTAPSTSRRR